MNADTKAVARELVAWFTSGNSVPVDVRHTAKVNGDRIMADAARPIVPSIRMIVLPVMLIER